MKNKALLLLATAMLSLHLSAHVNPASSPAKAAFLPPPASCTAVVLDQFTDGNYTAAPVWSGDTGEWQYQANSLSGADATNSRIVRVNPGNNNPGTYNLHTPVTTWNTNQEWGFWMGRLNATSATSTVAIWLYANETNLSGNTVDGYRLFIGDGGTQEIRLQRVVNGAVASDIIVSTGSTAATRTDYSYTIRVTRDETGLWRLFTSTLPTANGAGVAPTANPITSSTVSQGSGTDNNIIPSGTGYIGFSVLVPSVSSANGRTTEFDQIYFTPCQPNTTVQFGSATSTATEGTTTTVQIPVTITNSNPTAATTVQVALTSGTASTIGNYTTQTVTFPAGSNTTQNVTVTITDDLLCTGAISAYTFTLQNPSGGFIAILGAQTTHVLSESDNEYNSENIGQDNFEDGDISDWWTNVAGSFGALATNPINGSFSLRHVDQGQTTGGSTSVSKFMNGATLQGSETTWRFNLKYFNREPTTSDYFIVCLTNDEQNIADNTIDGYAIGIRPNIFNNTDFVTLWRTQNDMLTPILTTTLDWGAAQDVVGFEITRNANGVWEVKMDTNGNFDNLVSYGTATDTFWNNLGYFGTFLVYNTTTKGRFSMDDISITQQSCTNTFYSQLTGNSGAAVWAPTTVGTPLDITPGPFTSFVIQNGHTITMNENAIAHDYTIQTGGTLIGATYLLELKGNFIKHGTFTQNTSTLRFSGSTGAQQISGTGAANFFNLELNNASGLTSALPINLFGQLRPQAGTFNTNNQLTLVSNINGTGSIGTIATGANVTGQITLQRFIPTAPQYYVYLSNPLLNQTIQHWNDDMVTTGFPGSDYPSYSFNNIYWYDESQPGQRNIGWTGATNVTNALNPQRGYIVYMNSPASTVTASGDFQKGNVSVPLSFNDLEPGSGYTNPDGWNLIANVYPATIDWVALKNQSNTWASGNGTYYVYDAAGSNYRSYNANITGGTANRYIASCQAFFVQASGAGQTIDFRESIKSTDAAPFQRSIEESSLVRFNFTRGTMDDEILIALKDDATFAFDEMYDAIKWDSPVATAPELAILASDSAKLSINTIPLFEEGVEMHLWADMPAAGTYNLTMTQLQNLPLGVCITVEDVVNNTITPVALNEPIVITTTAAYSGYRFIIRMSAPLIVTPNNTSCFDVSDGSILVNTNDESWSIFATDELGNTTVASDGLMSGLSAGIYNITLENVNALCGGTSTSVDIAEPEAVLSELVPTVDFCNSGVSGRVEMIVDNTEHFNYTITNAEGIVVANGDVQDNYKIVPDLSYGAYSVMISSDCYNETMNVDLSDPNAVALDIVVNTPLQSIALGETVTISANALSESEVSYEWLVNGFDGGDNSYLSFAVNTAGVYNIQCVASNEFCSATSFSQAIVEEEEVDEEVTGLDENTNGVAAIITRMGNSVVVTFENASTSKAKISIYNSSGSLVMQVSGFADKGQVRTIDITGLASGIYTVNVEQDNNRLAQQQIVK